eukprot:NODE_710_length_4537_cov_0.398828.p3 type:complete len:254 gc:universal NODE_710_length_4537_cov_0.398828:1386-2147(+)
MIFLFVILCIAHSANSYKAMGKQIKAFHNAMIAAKCPSDKSQLTDNIPITCKDWLTTALNQAKIVNPDSCDNPSLNKRDETCNCDSNQECKPQSRVNRLLNCAKSTLSSINSPESKASRRALYSRIQSAIATPFRVLGFRFSILYQQWMSVTLFRFLTAWIAFLIIICFPVIPFYAIGSVLNIAAYLIVVPVNVVGFVLSGDFMIEWNELNNILWGDKEDCFDIAQYSFNPFIAITDYALNKFFNSDLADMIK